MEALGDLPRSGRPPVVTPIERHQVVENPLVIELESLAQRGTFLLPGRLLAQPLQQPLVLLLEKRLLESLAALPQADNIVHGTT